ncbi:MAG: TldD/PmbA family protein [Deltaproteobacteria bacterium]|nr:TldD/PmbA family protein [Deltaproteobacteria bacterium]
MDPIAYLEQQASLLKVDGYEFYRTRSRQLQIEAKGGDVESSEEAVSHGLAIRLIRQGRVGFASTSYESPASLEKALQLAYNTLDLVQEEVGVRFANEKNRNSFSPVFDQSLRERPFQEKARLALALEKEARDFDRRICRLRSVCYEEVEEEVELKTSFQFEGSYRRTLCELSLMVVAEEGGESETAWESDFSPSFDRLDPSVPARRAAEKAVSLLGAKPVSSRRCPALLEPSVAASFLSVLASSFMGDQVMRGRSILKDQVGKDIYSTKVSLLDDGRMVDGYLSLPFDGEGSPTKKNNLIKEGRLVGFLHDQQSSNRMGAELTGNGIRPSYKEKPRVGVSNFFLEPGQKPVSELMHQMENGFWITDLIGLHTANAVSGDFSLGATGFWVENGKKNHPVRGVAVSGNLHTIFKRVVEVGSDLKFFHSFGCPSLLISDIDLGGV